MSRKGKADAKRYHDWSSRFDTRVSISSDPGRQNNIRHALIRSLSFDSNIVLHSIKTALS